jgi:hypothetical protein
MDRPGRMIFPLTTRSCILRGPVRVTAHIFPEIIANEVWSGIGDASQRLSQVVGNFANTVERGMRLKHRKESKEGK